ncbi:MAG: hypothetical protein PVH87_14550 [Desulfobacteraceae bacterium]|jgi:hypothetical protein
MAKIIQLAEYKAHSALEDGYRRWRALFNETFEAGTRLSDLSPKTLCWLAEPGDESATAIHTLIIGFLGHGDSVTFYSLDSKVQSQVLDIFLFLSDQFRFEMMYRLGWLECFLGNQYALFEMVTEFERIKKKCQDQPPSLSKDHNEYETYSKLFERDQQVFIRRMLTSALQVFKQTFALT